MATVDVIGEPQIQLTLTMREAAALYFLFGETDLQTIELAGLPNLFRVIDPIVSSSRYCYSFIEGNYPVSIQPTVR